MLLPNGGTEPVESAGIVHIQADNGALVVDRARLGCKLRTEGYVDAGELPVLVQEAVLPGEVGEDSVAVTADDLSLVVDALGVIGSSSGIVDRGKAAVVQEITVDPVGISVPASNLVTGVDP